MHSGACHDLKGLSLAETTCNGIMHFLRILSGLCAVVILGFLTVLFLSLSFKLSLETPVNHATRNRTVPLRLQQREEEPIREQLMFTFPKGLWVFWHCCISKPVRLCDVCFDSCQKQCADCQQRMDIGIETGTLLIPRCGSACHRSNPDTGHLRWGTGLCDACYDVKQKDEAQTSCLGSAVSSSLRHVVPLIL